MIGSAGEPKGGRITRRSCRKMSGVHAPAVVLSQPYDQLSINHKAHVLGLMCMEEGLFSTA